MSINWVARLIGRRSKNYDTPKLASKPLAKWAENMNDFRNEKGDLAIQYPKVNDSQFYIQNINPVEWLKPLRTVGQSNDLAYAVRRRKELAEMDGLQARYLSFYRVIEHWGEVVFLSHVNFQTVTHYDMREKLKSGKNEHNEKGGNNVGESGNPN